MKVLCNFSYDLLITIVQWNHLLFQEKEKISLFLIDFQLFLHLEEISFDILQSIVMSIILALLQLVSIWVVDLHIATLRYFNHTWFFMWKHQIFQLKYTFILSLVPPIFNNSGLFNNYLIIQDLTTLWFSFYCCVTNYYNFSILKQQKFISQFLWVHIICESRCDLAGYSAQDHRLESRHQLGLRSHLSLLLGSDDCWENWVPYALGQRSSAPREPSSPQTVHNIDVCFLLLDD